MNSRGSGNEHNRLLPRLPSAPPPEEKSKEDIEEEERQFERIKKNLADDKYREGSAASAITPSELKTLPRLPSDLPPPKSPTEIAKEAEEFERIKKSTQNNSFSSSFREAFHHLPRLPSALPPLKTREELEKEEAEFDSFQNAIHFLPRAPSTLPPTKSKEEREREIEEFDRLRNAQNVRILHPHSPTNRVSSSFRSMVSGLPKLKTSPSSFTISKEELEREAVEFEVDRKYHDENENDEARAREEEEKKDKMRAQDEAKDKKEEEEELKKFGTNETDKSCMGSLKRRAIKFRRYFIKETKERHAIERLLFCGLAVALIWGTSLHVCRSIVGTFIIGPQLDDVVDSAKVAVDRTVEERQRYLSCSNRRVDRCNATFTQELDAEVERAKNVMKSNRAALNNYTEIREIASANFGYTITILDFIENNLTEDIASYGTSEWNTNPICNQVKDLVKQQTAAKESSKNANNFKSSADATIDDLLNQIDARQEYDRNYIANKIGHLNAIGIDLGNYVEVPSVNFGRLGASRDKLIACTTSVTGTYNGQTCNGQSLAYRMNSYKNSVTNAYQSAYDSVHTMIDNANVDFNGLKDFYDSFTGEINRFSGLIKAISDALPSGVSISDLHYNANLDTHLPSFSEVNIPSIGAINTNFDLQPINTNLNVDTTQVTTTLSQQKDNAVANAEAIRARQKAWQEKFFADYNPPAVGVNVTRSSWSGKSESFIPNVNTNLGLLSTRVKVPPRPDISISTNFTSIAHTVSQLIKNLLPRHIDFYVYDDISIPDIRKYFFSINILALNFDYIYRVVRSVQVMRKYWRISEVATPPADIREKGSKGKSLVEAPFKNPIQKMGDLITNPIVLFALFVIVLAFVIIMFLVFYVPIYNTYTAGCVQNTYSAQGTVITRNVNTLAFHYSASAGDSVADTAIDKQNVVRELQCEKNTQETYNVLVQNLDEYTFYQNKLNELSAKNAPFQICVNTTKIDKMHPLAAYNATHGNATSMHSTVFHPYLNETLPQLDPSLFNCSKLSLCEVECDGPNNDTIRSATFNAGCNVEWYLHANFLGFFLSLLVFVLLNVSRGIFLRGLVHLLWRNVAIPKFSYIGSCYETGQLVFPSAVTKEGKSMKQVIREALKQSLKKLTRMGYIFLFTTVILNLPWIILLYILSKDLVFVPVS